MKILLIDVYNFNKGGAENSMFSIQVNYWKSMDIKLYTSV